MQSSELEGAEPAARQAETERYEPGSDADFERLYRNTYRRIVGTLITIVRDVSTAEDCAQETYERAYRGWAKWRPDAPVEAWLHRIAINVAISDRRYQRLRQAGEVIRMSPAEELPPPQEALEGKGRVICHV